MQLDGFYAPLGSMPTNFFDHTHSDTADGKISGLDEKGKVRQPALRKIADNFSTVHTVQAYRLNPTEVLYSRTTEPVQRFGAVGRQILYRSLVQ
jgi:hypothetical protein